MKIEKHQKPPISIQKYIKTSYEYIIPYAFAFIIFFLIEFLVYGAENNDIGRNSLYAVFVSTDTLNIILSLLLSEAIQRIICKSGSVVIWIALISGLIFYIVFKLIAVFSINNIVLNISGMINLAYLICTMIFVAKGALENARIKTQS
ncbi:MAG: hypothetical protein ACI3T9_06855 [Romboutsia timonensis]